MAPLYTGKGDSGDTGFLGKGRLSKSSVRIESVGSIDEASAAIGFARSLIQNETTYSILLKIQKKLYVLLTELSALPDEEDNFSRIEQDDVQWVENQIKQFEEQTPLPREFIIPGDTPSSGALDVARTIVRRAERRVIAFLSEAEQQRSAMVAFLNRLSSLLFILEVDEAVNNSSGNSLTLAKEDGE